MNRLFFSSVLAFGLSGAAFAQTVPESMVSALVWRNIGPFRGGRVAAVSGAVRQPGVFYMGLPAGGVWKTTSAGVTWYPVMDSVREASSVGAVEVAPSDPNVIYAGMGDMIAGGGINEGNGVYKSMDAGRTWVHVGLDETKQIPSLLVDPHDPNLVLAAALGNIHAKSEQRGLFRSTDGGKTWAKTLYVDDETGVQKIAWAYDHPEAMLATTARHYQAPGAGRGFGYESAAGNSGTRLYKSTDEGLTWKELKGGGLPSLAGRTCVAVANGTNAQRMFLVGNFGLYRSDDGGTTWRQMDASDRRVANGQGGYNCGVYVNPKDPETVYVINTCSYISHDGGNTFTGFKGAPGGDDPQQMWLDPTDGNRLFFGTDQGATVSLDGGQTWSSWYNQATAQVYHISVDNQFPYWVYATQQDSGSIATASRGNLGQVGPLDWLPHPGYEFGSIVADPLNPKVSYAGGETAGIEKVTYPSGQWINVSPNMDSKLALRQVRNQPLLFSPTNPHELLTGFQYVMATTDGGQRWRKLSPDVTKRSDEPAQQQPTGTPPVRASGNVQEEESDEEDEEGEEQGPRGPGGAIECISASSVSGEILWVGTNNGLIKVTRDHGASWEDAAIPGLPGGARADISAIDASHQEPGTAYAAVDCHATGDYKPYFYRTRDFGRTWTPIVTGLPDNLVSGSFARVIRADTKRQGLLFAGTESSVYVSFDDGDHWQPLTLNLPNTSVRDMVVKESDLVVGTYGRGFWILDDISPLRQISAATVHEAGHLFKPADAIRVRRNVNNDTPFPPEVPHAKNPPTGAIIYYSLAAKPAGDITLEVKDSAGRIVRRMSSAPIPPRAEPPPPIPDFWIEQPQPLPAAPGLNRAHWDLRLDSPSAFSHGYEINAIPGETPAAPEGPLALPGVYTVTLTVDGKAVTQTVTVKNDLRSPATAADLRAQHGLQEKLYRCAQESFARYQETTRLRAEVAAALKSNPPDDVAKAARALDEKLSAMAGTTGFGRRFGGFAGAGGPPRQPTFSGLNGTAIRLLKQLDTGDQAPAESAHAACAAACAEMQTAMKGWETLKAKELLALNALLAKNSLKTLGKVEAETPGRAAR